MFENISKSLFTAAMLAVAAPASAVLVDSPVAFVSLSGSDALETGPNANISFAYLYDNSTFDHNGGSVSFAYLYNQSRETVRATQSWLYSYDQSNVIIGDGADMSWLVMFGNSSATMTGGTLAIAVIGENANALFDFTNAGSLSSLRFADTGGRVTVRGYNLVATSSSIDGQRSDGSAFSMSMTFSPCAWDVSCYPESIDPGNFAGLQLDNLGMLPPTGGVPDASTWSLLLIGFGAMGGVARRRRSISLAV